jgi:hypothetical protein
MRNFFTLLSQIGIWLILFAVSINRICSYLPSTIYFDPFPFYNIVYDGNNVGISLQSYVYFIAVHLSIIAIWLFCMFEMPQYKLKSINWRWITSIFSLFFILEVGSLIDFLLIYEHAIFHIGFYPIEFTDFKLILYTSIIILWKHGKL